MAHSLVAGGRPDCDTVAGDVLSILNGSTPGEDNSAVLNAGCHDHAAGKVVDDDVPVGPGTVTTDVLSTHLVVDRLD